MPNKAEAIGILREQIALQSVTETQSTSGYPVEVWATYATVWAQAKHRLMVDDEKQMAEKRTALQTIIFRIRYRSDVTEKHRISYEGEVYDITGIAVSEDRFFIDLESEKRK